MEEYLMRTPSSLLIPLLLVGLVTIARAEAPEPVAQYRQGFAQALTAGDADTIAGWMAEDVQVFFPLHPFRVDGQDAVTAMYAEIFLAFPTCTVFSGSLRYGSTTGTRWLRRAIMSCSS
jgi:hypothetical protein